MLIAVVAGALVLVVVLALSARLIRSSRPAAGAAKPTGVARPPAAPPTPVRTPAARPGTPSGQRPPRDEPSARRQPSITTPRAPVTAAAPAAHVPPATPSARPTRPTVLVVDDSPIMRRTLMTLFAKAGYQTASAEGGAAAVTWIRGNGLPGLVTLDMEMPGMDGLQTLEALQALGAAGDVRAVFVTSKMHSARARETAARFGAIGFFSKPYDPNDLLALAQRVAPLA